MRRAILLAQRGYPAVAPNPAVGAVLVRNGEIVAEGWHREYGGPHAEINCLADAARRGVEPEHCTLLVTLEPCNHHGKTPPCTEAILRAGIRHVVVGCADPTPKAAGGADFLRRHGVRVEVGLLAQTCKELIADFLHWQTGDLPFLTLKMAASLDGFIATRTGKSRWLTGPAARERVHLLRSRNHAVLIGGGTLRADDPLLNVRPADFPTPFPGSAPVAASGVGAVPASEKGIGLNGVSPPDAFRLSGRSGARSAYLWPDLEWPQTVSQPVAVVLGNRALNPAALPRLLRERGRDLIFVTASNSPLAGQRELLAVYGAELLCFSLSGSSQSVAEPGRTGGGFSRQDLREILARLRTQFGLHRILCEGGGRLGLSLLQAGLVQEFELHQAPLLMADRQAVNLFDGLAPTAPDDALRLQLLQVGSLGGDIISRYACSNPQAASSAD